MKILDSVSIGIPSTGAESTAGNAICPLRIDACGLALRGLSLHPIFILLKPARMGLVHLLHGVLNGSIEVLGQVDVSGLDREVPGGRQDWSIGEHGLISNLLGGKDFGMVDTSDDLEAIISKGEYERFSPQHLLCRRR